MVPLGPATNHPPQQPTPSAAAGSTKSSSASLVSKLA